MRSTMTIIMAALACLIAANTAPAGLLPTKVSVTPESNDYRWTYGVVLTSDSQLHAGDFFTIYDFGGFIAGSNVQPSGFEFAATFVGPTPNRLNPDDDPGVMNLTWTYAGPDITAGQVGLGNFSANSISGLGTEGFFTSQTHRSIDGVVDSNITSTELPFSVPTIPTVPEPATLTLFGLGLPLAYGLRRFRDKSSAGR